MQKYSKLCAFGQHNIRRCLFGRGELTDNDKFKFVSVSKLLESMLIEEYLSTLFLGESKRLK